MFDAGLVEDSCLHCMITSAPVAPLHSSRVVVPTEEDEFRGFGRLRNSQYNTEEIEVIRLTYFPQVVAYSHTQPLRDQEDPHHRWLRLEEEWILMQVNDPTSEFFLNVGRHVIRGRSSHPLVTQTTATATAATTTAAAATVPPQTAEETMQMNARRDAIRAVNSIRTRLGLAAVVEGGGGGRRTPPDPAAAASVNNNSNIIGRAWPESSREGTNGEFVAGFAMGVILGIIMVFWLGESSLSKKQRCGVVCGILVNVGMQFVGHAGGSGGGSKHLRGSSGGDGLGNGTVAVRSEQDQMLIPVTGVAGNLPLSGVGSTHYSVKASKIVPERFG